MGAAFMYNDNTLKALRKVKDNDGRFIWQPADARTGEPAQLYGYPYAINQDMPDIGSTNKSVLFGAMQRYVMRRVRTFSTKRLVERYADFHQVGFIGFGRFDGELMDTAAVKHLVHPT
jgi:HK97 family phage major capsid protein